MDYLGEFVALGIDSIIFGICLKKYYHCKNAITSVKVNMLFPNELKKKKIINWKLTSKNVLAALFLCLMIIDCFLGNVLFNFYKNKSYFRPSFLTFTSLYEQIFLVWKKNSVLPTEQLIFFYNHYTGCWVSWARTKFVLQLERQWRWKASLRGTERIRDTPGKAVPKRPQRLDNRRNTAIQRQGACRR